MFADRYCVVNTYQKIAHLCNNHLYECIFLLFWVTEINGSLRNNSKKIRHETFGIGTFWKLSGHANVYLPVLYQSYSGNSGISIVWRGRLIASFSGTDMEKKVNLGLWKLLNPYSLSDFKIFSKIDSSNTLCTNIPEWEFTRLFWFLMIPMCSDKTQHLYDEVQKCDTFPLGIWPYSFMGFDYYDSTFSCRLSMKSQSVIQHSPTIGFNRTL
jgi:hypothetical protein